MLMGNHTLYITVFEILVQNRISINFQKFELYVESYVESKNFETKYSKWIQTTTAIFTAEILSRNLDVHFGLLPLASVS